MEEKKTPGSKDPIPGKDGKDIPGAGNDTTGKKGGKNHHRRRGKEDHKDQPSKRSMNDPRWYFVTDALLKSTASLSFPQWLGRGINLRGANASGTGIRESLVVRIPFYFSIGQSNGADSPFNLAVRNLYTYIRHANSGHTNYESADLGIYLLSVGAAIAQCSHLERLLGLAKLYKTRNAAVPMTLIEAAGVNNYSALVANLANYTARLNLLWARLSSLCLPTDFNFIKRWIWMCSQVFKDHESSKAAMYVFVPDCAARYQAKVLETGGAFSFGGLFASSIDDLFDTIEVNVSLILADEDMNIMSGDILKAYGADKLIKFGSTPLDYICEPVYVEEMLPQIHNMKTGQVVCTATGTSRANYRSCISYDNAVKLGQTSATQLASDMEDGAWIYQVDGELIETMTFAFGDMVTASNGATYYYTADSDDKYGKPSHALLLNSFSETPTPEEVTIATRLIYTLRTETRTNPNAVYLESSGTEVVPCVELFTCGRGGSSVAHSVFGTEVVVPANTSYNIYMNRLEEAYQFDWFPIIYRLNSASEIMSVGADLDNFTIVEDEFISAINTNAILGEFTVTAVNFLK